MAERTSVTVPLTARQKEHIKRVTGKSISAFKVEASPKSAPRLMLAKRMRIIAPKRLIAPKRALF